ncbi:MAG: RNA polymerase sigma-70 factor [Prevotella sp.]|nr:RNA polymerase sigma-70 factor [Prevotella sp.]
MNFQLLFRNYYRPLCLYALHYINNVDDVEDVVQDCFVRLLEASVEPRNVRAWLYAAVRNRCIDLLRQSSHSVEPLTVGQETATDEEQQERSLREARLWEAIDALPARCREVFLLSKRDGLTYAQIAQRLRLSEKTVEHQVSKALKRLRALRG